MKINGIKLELIGESYRLAGRGVVRTARLQGSYNRDDLNKLIGESFDGHEIIGVGSFAVYDQTNKLIELQLMKAKGSETRNRRF